MSAIRIVTRTSPLALWQAEFVQAALQKHHPGLSVTIHGIKTLADRWLHTSLQKIGGKGLFVKELELALLEGAADLAVHSLKDIPAVFPEGLGLAAVCARESPQDAWICPQGHSFKTLPAGGRVGTSSLRRVSQLRRLRPDLQYGPLRGNIGRRLEQCREGSWDGIVLAVAGLKRLQWENHVTEIFDTEQVLPAVGQGALGLECRWDDEYTRRMVSVLEHAPTRTCIEAERAMNAALGGSCHVPVAGFAECLEGRLRLRGRVGHPQEPLILEAQDWGTLEEPFALGQRVAQQLMAQGADQIIAACREP